MAEGAEGTTRPEKYLKIMPPQIKFSYDERGVSPAEIEVENLTSEYVTIKVHFNTHFLLGQN